MTQRNTINSSFSATSVYEAPKSANEAAKNPAASMSRFLS